MQAHHTTLTREERQRLNELLEDSFDNLDIYSMVEFHASIKLYPAHSGKQATGACPYGDCPGDTDGFIVFPTLSKLYVTDAAQIGRHYFCRTCKRSGHIVDLLMGVLGVRFPRACELLDIPNPYTQLKGERQTGERKPVDPRVLAVREQRRREEEARRREAQEEQDTLQMLYPRMQVMLQKHDRPRDYLKARAVPLELAASLGLAYVPPLEEIRITAADPQERDRQFTFFKKWSDRLIFPLTSRAGQGFTGRALALWTPGMNEDEHKARLEEAGIPRYRDTHTSGYFNAGILSSVAHITIVEGPFDALALLAGGVPDALATCGTSVDIEFIPLSICDATLAYDGDTSGMKSAQAWKRAMQRKGIETRRCTPPDDGMGKDWSARYRLHGLPGLAALHAPAQEVEAAAPVTDESHQAEAETLSCVDCGIGVNTAPDDVIFHLIGEGVYCCEECLKKRQSPESDLKSLCCRCGVPAEHSAPGGDAYCTEHYRCVRGHAPRWMQLPGTDRFVCECVFDQGQINPIPSVHDNPVVNFAAALFHATLTIDPPGYTIQDRVRDLQQAEKEQMRVRVERARSKLRKKEVSTV
jgi:Toprim-like